MSTGNKRWGALLGLLAAGAGALLGCGQQKPTKTEAAAPAAGVGQEPPYVAAQRAQAQAAARARAGQQGQVLQQKPSSGPK